MNYHPKGNERKLYSTHRAVHGDLGAVHETSSAQAQRLCPFQQLLLHDLLHQPVPN